MRRKPQKMIGAHMRPGMTRGGFAAGAKFASEKPARPTKVDHRMQENKEIIEAANAILEGRRMER